MKSSIIKRSIVVDGRKTSISLENSFWIGLKEIAASRGMHVSQLASTIKAESVQGRSFTSTVRVYVLAHFRDRLQAVAGFAH
jgi:predicted DNA-binding ribbon-helix-helix protein